MLADIKLEQTTVHVEGDLVALDGRLLIQGDAIVARFNGADHVIPLRALYALCQLATNEEFLRGVWLNPDLREDLGLPPIVGVPVHGPDWDLPHIDVDLQEPTP